MKKRLEPSGFRFFWLNRINTVKYEPILIRNLNNFSQTKLIAQQNNPDYEKVVVVFSSSLDFCGAV